MNENSDITFQQIIDELLDFDTPFPAQHLYTFSDINRSDLDQLTAVWSELPDWSKRGLIEDLAELSDRNTLLSFKNVCQFAADDKDPKVRLSAVNALWIYEETSLAYLYMNLLKNDQDLEVRAAAAGALSQFVFLGEIEAIENNILHEVEQRLLETYRSSDPDLVRRGALESLGFSGRTEVTHIIEEAYLSGKNEWIASSLLAMGRSADEQWHPYILEMLNHKIPLIRCEAARAAGELEINEAVSPLKELLDDPDEDTRLASIWSLAQIGGEGVGELLEDLLEESDDEQDRDFIDTAIENLAFNESVELFPLFDFPDEAQDEILEDQNNGFDEIEDSTF